MGREEEGNTSPFTILVASYREILDSELLLFSLTIVEILKLSHIPSTVRDTDFGMNARASGTTSTSSKYEHSV